MQAGLPRADSPRARSREGALSHRLAALLSCAVAVQIAWAQPPRVRLFATGGTISARPGARLTAEELVAAIPDVARYARVETEQVANLPSSALTFADWLRLARRIRESFSRDAELAGAVVTCGTDTLEELAYFLHLTIRDERPVVVVGAMRRPGLPGAEGPANLLAGIRVAADANARRRGAMVVLNDEINSAREVAKTDALRLQTFQSRPYGVLGVVDADRVVFYRDTLRRHTYRSEFDVSALDALPRVDVLLTYQEAPGDLVRAAVDAGAAGLVIAGAGAGALSPSQREALRYALEKNVVVVIASRTGSGRVRAPDGGEARGGGGEIIGAEDLSPIKARVLLMLALTRTKDRREIQRMFEEY
ncbi:MAG TPA: asparaginase [Vicinamibacterales bacterium]|nr:asparaginase [Vicinamibacterales bacterium]